MGSPGSGKGKGWETGNDGTKKKKCPQCGQLVAGTCPNCQN